MTTDTPSRNAPATARRHRPATVAGGLRLSVVAAAAILLGAFAGGRAQAAEPPTFDLLIKDGRLQPETLEVPAGTRFRLQVKNEGPGAAEFESKELRKELVLAPGVTRVLVFAPMKPGSYRFFDEFHEATAQGTIIVK